MFFTLFYFILALILLIFIHELGHFLVARWCGVKVLRFSLGFGKILARYRDKRGTEYAWSLFPLGGYVKMLDESEGDVPEQELHLAFNNQSVWSRIAIVIAGPLFNFLFAFVALWLMWIIGIKTIAPIIETIHPESIAAQAGLQPNQEFIAIQDKPVKSWRDVQYRLMPLLGSGQRIKITVQDRTTKVSRKVYLSLQNWVIDNKKPDILKSLGIIPFIPRIPPIIAEIQNNTPASSADLQSGDIIAAVDGQKMDDWLTLLDYIKKRPNTLVTLNILRNGAEKKVVLTTGQTKKDKQWVGYLGIRSQKMDWPADWLRLQRHGPIQALGVAFKQTMDITTATLTLMGRLVFGQLPLGTLSGPIGIAQGAGQSARGGIAYYLSFLALVSISLGVLNMLPIPMLDGGHLFFYIVEIVRRRPLSDEIKSASMYIGMVVLMILMFVAISNDVSRLTAH